MKAAMKMKPTLYYVLFGAPSRACLFTTKLIGLDVNSKLVDFSKKEHLSEEFIKLNPQHTVPVLVDNGGIIWDSHAINTYLVSKYAKDDRLYPKDLLKRARIDQRMYFENGVLFPVVKDFVRRIIYDGETEINSKSIQLAYSAYDFLENFLENDYLVGNSMTLADVSNQTTVISLRTLVPIEIDRYPKITAWLKRMESLPDNIEINEKGAEQFYQRIASALNNNMKRSK